MVNWKDINVEDYLVRRLNGNPATRRIIDAAKYGDNFILGEGSKLRGLVRPNVKLGQSGGTVYHNVPTKNFPAVVKSNVPAKPIKVIPKVNTNFKAINEGLDTIYDYTRTGAKTAGDRLAQAVRIATNKPSVFLKPIVKGVQKAAPFVSDAALIKQGYGDIKSGHPKVGLARIGIGGAGEILDALSLAELLSAPVTGGAGAAGAVGTQALKQGAKKSLLSALEKAAAKDAGRWATGRFAVGEGLGLLKSQNQAQAKKEEGSGNKNKGSQPEQKTQSYNQVNSQSYPSGPMGVDEFTRMYGGQYGNEQQDVQQDVVDNTQAPSVGQVQQDNKGNLDLSQILELYREMNRVNEPYIDRVQEYANRYPQLQSEAYNRDRYLAALSGLSDNSAYQRMMGRYNPAEIEAQQIDLEGKTTAQRQKQLEDLMELLGNATIVNELNLPTTAAMANKNILNTYTSLGKAQMGLQGKMYGADRSAQAKMYVADRISKAKEYDTYVDNQIRMAIAKGNWQNARQLQQMKNDNRIQTSIITGIPFAELGQLFEGTNALGVTTIDTSGFNTGSMF